MREIARLKLSHNGLDETVPASQSIYCAWAGLCAGSRVLHSIHRNERFESREGQPTAFAQNVNNSGCSRW